MPQPETEMNEAGALLCSVDDLDAAAPVGKPAVESAGTLVSDVSRFWKQQSFDLCSPEGIVIPERLRASICQDTVVSLMASIENIGLQTPITVRIEDEESSPILIAGRH